MGNGLSKVFYTPKPADLNPEQPSIDEKSVRNIIQNSENGYLSPEKVQQLIDAAGISRAKEAVAETVEKAEKSAEEIGYPLVMKVVGPIHKSDVGGVVLNVKDKTQMKAEFERMIKIKDTTAILLQPFLTGRELYTGATFEDKFGHLILAGMGGIYIEILKDISSALAPIDKKIALEMINSLKSIKLLQGARGQEGVNIEKFADILVRLSALLKIAPEIKEMDLNPLLGSVDKVVAVDARIRIEK